MEGASPDLKVKKKKSGYDDRMGWGGRRGGGKLIYGVTEYRSYNFIFQELIIIYQELTNFVWSFNFLPQSLLI